MLEDLGHYFRLKLYEVALATTNFSSLDLTSGALWADLCCSLLSTEIDRFSDSLSDEHMSKLLEDLGHYFRLKLYEVALATKNISSLD